MKLVIDYREKRSGILALLEKEPDNHIAFQNLKIGDYIVEDKIIIERKTLEDFLASVKNGRFFRQSYRSANHQTPYILILEGDKSQLSKSSMKREAIQGALLHISVFLGIPVLRSRNIEETLQLMKMAALQLAKNNPAPQSRVYKQGIKAKHTKSERIRIQALMALPGVGGDKASAMLQKFGSLRNVFNAPAAELVMVKGIGKKTAEKIVIMATGACH